MDNSLIDNIEFDGVNHKDYPDYSDAYIVSAEYNGILMNDEQLEEINEDRCFIHEQLFNQLF